MGVGRTEVVAGATGVRMLRGATPNVHAAVARRERSRPSAIPRYETEEPRRSCMSILLASSSGCILLAMVRSIGQAEGECRALAGLGVDRQFSAVGLDYLLRER